MRFPLPEVRCIVPGVKRDDWSLEDRVATPNQSRVMADALRASGLPVAADTIVRCLEAELSFYGRLPGFVPADGPSPIGQLQSRRAKLDAER